jgi:hypothetical protein|tara:strand:+ start:1972 stop:2313 length:342 start_codon:yes stop_codon:yes gene_type:complete
MDDVYLEILFEIGIENIEKIDGTLLERDYLLDDVKYQKIKEKIFVLKKYFSSSLLTSLQENAEEKQKFPLINIVRQLLKVKYFKMEPIRKANGYEKSGKKMYKRFFLIKKMDE